MVRWRKSRFTTTDVTTCFAYWSVHMTKKKKALTKLQREVLLLFNCFQHAYTCRQNHSHAEARGASRAATRRLQHRQRERMERRRAAAEDGQSGQQRLTS